MIKSFSACCKYSFALVISCMMAQPVSALTFSMDTVTGAPLDQVVVSIRTYDFTDLIAIQGTIQFDPAVAQFVKIETYGLPNMGVANFGTTQAASGKVTFSWDDPTLNGVTINDSVIFSIRFTLVGTAGQQSVVSFANVPTSLEFSDITFNTVNADFLNNGLIQIPGGADPCDTLVCDDSNLCTTDTCLAGACDFSPIICNDGDNCTNDLCSAGLCVFNRVVCNDTDLCTIDTCINGSCLFIPISCNDDDACTVDQCAGGSCTNSPTFCDDGNACTTDGCDSIAGCTSTPVICDDGDACTTDSCDAGNCVYNPVVCDDGDDCTADFCVGTCQFTPINCDDGDLCTNDSCFAGACEYATVNCDDNDVCTTDSCASGSCINTIIPGCNDPCDTLNCTDSDLCTTDTCISGFCEYTPITCDDGDNCTNDGCDSVSGCTFTAVICDDGDPCTTDECLQGACYYYPVQCNDGDFCTTDFCDAGICQYDPVVCDDGDVCTNDACTPLVGCATTAVDCDDGDNCTVDVCVAQIGCSNTDTCTQVGFRLEMEMVTGAPNTDVVMPVKAYGFNLMVAMQGTIQFDPSVAAFVQTEAYGLPGLGVANFGTTQAPNGKLTFSWDDAALTGVSVPDTTVIFAIRFHLANAGQTATSFVSLPTLLEFTDVNFNSVTPTLIDGLIEISGDPCATVNCDDTDACTTDSCDSGNCINTPVICDDGNVCTTDDCNSVVGCITTPVVCDDGDDCTSDACDRVTGCTATPIDCNDNDACTTDSCSGGTCINTVISGCLDPCDTLVCDDLNPCTIDACSNGSCSNTPVNCDDGNDCTADFCDLGTCYNNAIPCDDGNDCTTDVCVGGVCKYNPINCSDGDACTNDGCQAGICSNTPINCDDADQCTIDACANGVCSNTDTCTVSGLRLAMDMISGAQGAEVVLPVRAYGFTDMIAIQGTVQFNPAVAQFVQMESYGLPGLGLANFGTTQIASGKLTFSWDDATLLGVTVASGTEIFSIRFKLVGNAGESTITSFVNNPTVLEFTDVNFNTVTATLTNGLIEISGGCVPACDDGDACTTDACVSGSCVYTAVNCDDANDCTNDFCDLGSCVHTQIDCDDSDPCTSDFCSAGSCINTPIICDDGNICTADSCVNGNCIFTLDTNCVNPCDTMVCDDLNPCTSDLCSAGSCINTPINCDDGDDCTNDFCDLGNCFHSTITCDDGDDCTNDVCVGGACKYNPVSCDDGDGCTTDACVGGNCTYTTVTCDDGYQCTIDECSNGLCSNTDTCTTSGLRLAMITVSGAQGTDVIMPIRAYGFNDIIAIQGTIQFDPAVASFVSMDTSSFGLPGLSAANFGTTQSPNGIITFSWDDATLSGVSVPNSSVIFAIRFHLTGNPGEQTATSFVGTPTLLEFIDVNFNSLTAILDNGLIQIIGGPTITTSGITPSTFCAGDNVTVNFNKTGTFNPGNIFTAQLSDENGSFTNPVDIGSITDTVPALIFATLPTNATSGSNYRIRVVSSSPVVNGSDNGTDLVINAVGTAEVTIAASHTISCPGDNVIFTATPVNGGPNPTFDWFVNGTSQGVNAPVFNTTLLNDGDIVHAVMTSNAACISTATDTSNGIMITITSSTLTPEVTNSASAIDICAGETVTFTATPINGGANPVYEWFLNDISTGVSASVYSSSSLSSGDSVKVQMTSSLSCASPSSGISNSIRVFVNPLVNASVSIVASDTNICSGQNVTFTATPVGGGTNPSYQWQVNGLDTGSNSPIFTYMPNNGDVVHVEMTSSERCANLPTAISNSETISVTQSVTPSASISSNSTQTCIGDPITLTATITNGGPNPILIWRINGTDSVTTSNVFTYQPDDGDEASLILISSLTCANLDTVSSNSIIIAVASSLTPTVTITASSTSICPGDNVTFNALAVNGGATPSYQWLVNGTAAGSNSSTFSTTTLDDNDKVSAILVSSLSCANPDTAYSNTITISLAAAVMPSVSISASATNICQGNSVTFVATPMNGGITPSYQWEVNGNSAGINSDTFNTTSLNNGDAVKVKMTSSSTCASPATVTSNIIRMSVTPRVTPSVSISTGSTTACVNDIVTFQATPVNGGTTPTYTWMVNGTNTGATSDVFSSVLNDGDMVYVEMTSSDGCATSGAVSSDTITMSVVTTITPSVTISVNANNVCEGSTVTFTAAPVNGGIAPSYQWKIDNVDVGPNSPLLLTSAIINGSQVLLEMTSSFSCATPSTVTSNMVSMIVGAPQTISFTGLNAEYCVDAPAQSLTGIPLGGGFTGRGISGNTFVPYHAGPGTYLIGYSFVSATGCTAITSQSVTVHKLPVVNFLSLDNSYCSLQQTDSLIGIPSGGTFTGTGISGNTLSIPTVNNVTNISITYSYTDSNSCKGTVTKVTTINPVITPALVGVSKNYCENQNAVNLSAVPGGGTFAGAGVTGNSLDPSLAGVGSHALEYTYIDGNNCPNKATETFIVNQPPQVSLNVATEYCFNSPPAQLVGTPAGGEFTSNDQTGNDVVNGDFFAPNNGSPDSTYTVMYSYTDNNQCSNSTTQSVHILNPPFVEFEMNRTTFCSYENSVFLDVTIPGGNFYGAGITGDIFNPSAVGPGDYYVAYYLTNVSGCTGSTKILLKVDECTGIAEAEQDLAVLVFPNPSEGIFLIENVTDKGGDMNLQVFSIEGKLLTEKKIANFHKGAKERLDMSSYAEGMYLLKLNFGDETIIKRLAVSR